MMLLSLLGGLAYYVPVVIVLLVGVVLTARARREHGRGATLGMFGCMVLLLNTLLEAARNLALPTLVGMMRGQLDLVIAVSGIVLALLYCAGVSLLIAAVVARRTGVRQASQDAPYGPTGPGWQSPPGPGWQSQPGPGWQPPQPPAPR